MLLDHLQSAPELLDQDLLGLDTVDQLEPLVTHRLMPAAEAGR